jgi:hypothetical protein
MKPPPAQSISHAKPSAARKSARPSARHVARLGSRAVSADAMVVVQHAAGAITGESNRFGTQSLLVSQPRQGARPIYEKLTTVDLLLCPR